MRTNDEISQTMEEGTFQIGKTPFMDLLTTLEET